MEPTVRSTTLEKRKRAAEVHNTRLTVIVIVLLHKLVFPERS